MLPVALAPALAWAAPPPSVTARLEYQRGPGAEACAGEASLRIEVARRSGYDPFTADARARLVVTITRKGRQLVGALQFYDVKGAPGWSKVLPVRANDCGTLLAAMGAEIEYELSQAPTFPAEAPPVVAPPRGASVARAPRLALLLRRISARGHTARNPNGREEPLDAPRRPRDLLPRERAPKPPPPRRRRRIQPGRDRVIDLFTQIDSPAPHHLAVRKIDDSRSNGQISEDRAQRALHGGHSS